MNTLLIIDVSYLAHRSFHALQSRGNILSFKGFRTEVLYLFFRDLTLLHERFEPDSYVFAFDTKSSLRRDIYPNYKKKRLTEPEDVQTKRRVLRKQIRRLRKTLLPKVGFNNLFWQEGYEADDVIASVCDNLEKDQEAVIVSADTDLYQLINGQVSIWNPHSKTRLTLQGFKKKYGIKPIDWITVKAMCGCSTDEVKGIKGLGEKGAIAYIRNELPKHIKKYQAIESEEGNRTILRNLGLVTIPFPNIDVFDLNEDNVTEQNWKTVMKLLGIRSLAFPRRMRSLYHV